MLSVCTTIGLSSGEMFVQFLDAWLIWRIPPGLNPQFGSQLQACCALLGGSEGYIQLYSIKGSSLGNFAYLLWYIRKCRPLVSI